MKKISSKRFEEIAPAIEELMEGHEDTPKNRALAKGARLLWKLRYVYGWSHWQGEEIPTCLEIEMDNREMTHEVYKMLKTKHSCILTINSRQLPSGVREYAMTLRRGATPEEEEAAKKDFFDFLKLQPTEDGVRRDGDRPPTCGRTRP